MVKPLGNLLAGVPGYLGASVLGDARVALIVDPNHLLRASGAVSASGERTADHAEPPRILVVDDQLAVRSLQRNILESAGFRVEAAENGRTALEVLRRDADIDLVLTDVQMPELDGFDLLRSIRADEHLSALPAIVVTSVGSPEDRQRGMEAGADAYLIKDAFDQRTLLDTVERLIGR